MSKRGISFLLVICLVFGLFSVSALAASHPFTDVPAGEWFAPYVAYVYEEGIMQGTTATTFAPNANFSRAQVVATLFRIYNERRANAEDPTETDFTDVPEDEWYAPYIAWAVENEITTGNPDGTFAPNAPVSRQQFATFMFRYATYMTDMDVEVVAGPYWNNFTDRAQIESWAVDALTWANYNGIINGRTATLIAPADTTIRAEAAAMLTRLVGGEVEAPQPPTRMDIRALLGVNVSVVIDAIGDPYDTEPYNDGMFYFFEPDLSVYTDADGIILSVLVFYVDEYSFFFHLGGFDGDSTRAQVVAELGDPHQVDTVVIGGVEITYYTYLSVTGNVIEFIFFDDQVIGLSYGVNFATLQLFLSATQQIDLSWVVE